ncbi:MAG TPA: YggS family pyridoxal phosphate-dependent enzyme [Casimicrobiaceae bacterium]|nr:YggS family pyridoxal phosphate-dependent enzyme [Casimicrobiaceae bacterium]
MSAAEKAWQGVMARVARAASAAGRNPATVGILAVSKTFPPEAIRAVHGAGARMFGENYVQEALGKMDVLKALTDVEWHLIGPLQGNKARLAADRFAWVHTIDRLKIAERLSAARSEAAPPLNVCIQVNVSGEISKSGLPAGEAVALAPAVAALPRLSLRGFMAIAEATDDVARQRAQFRIARECLDAARAGGLDLDTLSMGMSDDLESAIAEGATLVRIGSAIFGPRSPAPRSSTADLQQA